MQKTKTDKLGNTVTYLKAGKPQAGAVLAASTYPQLNVSSEGRSRHVQRAREGRVPASTLGIWDVGSAALPKLHKVATSLGNTPTAQQCPGSARCSPARGLQLQTLMSCSKKSCFGAPLQGCASAWGHLAQNHRITEW